MLHKEFFRYVVPSMIAFAFSGVYCIVDGWFIGNNIGEIGLAAINVAYPITAIIQATGTGIGMGGAVLISISRGRSDLEAQKNYFGITVMLLLFVGLAEMILMYLFYPNILHFFGAAGGIMSLGSEYIRWIIYGTMFQMIGTGLVPLVRNYNGAVVAMISMVCGFLTNVILDWLFIAVMQLGMPGAAVATVLGQGVAIIPSLIFLIKEKKLFGYMKCHMAPVRVKEVFIVAASPFGLTLSPNIILIIINKNAILHGGTAAAACYAVVCYVVYVVQMLLQGVGDGCQPLISRYFGLSDPISVKKLRKMAYLFAEVIAVVFLGLFILLSRPIAVFFGMRGVGVEDVAVALPIFAAGFVFLAVLKVTTSCCYAAERNIYAYVLIYGELIGIGLLAGLILPPFLGIMGVWIAVPAAQAILCMVAVVLQRSISRDENRESETAEVRGSLSGV